MGRVPLEYSVTRPELRLRGMVVLVGHARDDGFSADGSQAGESVIVWPTPVRESPSTGDQVTCQRRIVADVTGVIARHR